MMRRKVNYLFDTNNDHMLGLRQQCFRMSRMTFYVSADILQQPLGQPPRNPLPPNPGNTGANFLFREDTRPPFKAITDKFVFVKRGYAYIGIILQISKGLAFVGVKEINLSFFINPDYPLA